MGKFLARDTKQEIELVNLTFKEKIMWTIRIWTGHKTLVKYKVLNDPNVDYFEGKERETRV